MENSDAAIRLRIIAENHVGLNAEALRMGADALETQNKPNSKSRGIPLVTGGGWLDSLEDAPESRRTTFLERIGIKKPDPYKP